ncbi:MAG: GNAT family N-acetyltransferase, partial [bacterium]
PCPFPGRGHRLPFATIYSPFPLPYSNDLSRDCVEIRNPDKTHLPAVFALLRRCFPGAWTDTQVVDRIFYDQRYDPNYVWMAREQGRVLGFTVAVQDGDEAWLKLLAVDPEFRRKGIGRDLLGRAEFRLSGEGARGLRVTSAPPYEFLPGPVPGSGESAFFVACGYAPQAMAEARYLPVLGGLASGIIPDLDDRLRGQALAWARERCGPHLGWVEESLACRPAKVVFDPQAGLCLAEPGLSLGPLWMEPNAEPARLKALAAAAWNLAGTLVPVHPLGLRLWELPGCGPLPGGRVRVQAYQPFFKNLV